MKSMPKKAVLPAVATLLLAAYLTYAYIAGKGNTQASRKEAPPPEAQSQGSGWNAATIEVHLRQLRQARLDPSAVYDPFGPLNTQAILPVVQVAAPVQADPKDAKNEPPKKPQRRGVVKKFEGQAFPPTGPVKEAPIERQQLTKEQPALGHTFIGQMQGDLVTGGKPVAFFKNPSGETIIAGVGDALGDSFKIHLITDQHIMVMHTASKTIQKIPTSAGK